MDARRVRILLGPGIAAGLLAILLAVPASAADCALTAPAAINVGDPLTIEGSGFPASVAVDIELSIDGAAADAFPVQSDSSGSLQITLTPENADIGTTTVVATAGSTCTAEVTYIVVAAGEQLPQPTPEPTPEPATGGTSPTAPRTDESTHPGGQAGTGIAAALALLLLTVGATGLLLTRASGRR